MKDKGPRWGYAGEERYYRAGDLAERFRIGRATLLRLALKEGFRFRQEVGTGEYLLWADDVEDYIYRRKV